MKRGAQGGLCNTGLELEDMTGRTVQVSGIFLICSQLELNSSMLKNICTHKKLYSIAWWVSLTEFSRKNKVYPGVLRYLFVLRNQDLGPRCQQQLGGCLITEVAGGRKEESLQVSPAELSRCNKSEFGLHQSFFFRISGGGQILWSG